MGSSKTEIKSVSFKNLLTKEWPKYRQSPEVASGGVPKNLGKLTGSNLCHGLCLIKFQT